MGSALRAFKSPDLPENYFRVEVKILRALGIELMKEESPMYRLCSRVFLLFVVYVFTIMETLELYAQWGDLNAIVNLLNYLITHITGVIKVTLLYYNRKKIGNIIHVLHKEPFHPNPSRGDVYEKDCVRNTVKITEIQLTLYFVIISGTINSGAVTFFKTRLFNEKQDWVYPFVPITIFDTSETPFFEMAGVYQIIYVLLFAAIIATTYVLLSSIMAHIATQMKILQNAFRTLPLRVERLSRDTPNDKEFHARVVFKEYIQHHLKVYDLAVQLENICYLMILAVLLASVLMLCGILYQSSRSEIGSIAFVQNAFFYFIVVCQVGMYCYWGNEVTLEAQHVAHAVAEMDWVDLPLDVQKGLVLVIARSQRPIYMTAGKFVPLSMIMFMNILKGSFSYFMVLRQTQETI